MLNLTFLYCTCLASREVDRGCCPVAGSSVPSYEPAIYGKAKGAETAAQQKNSGQAAYRR